MDIISESQYIFEKQAFKKLLIDARMHEIVYAETFSLIFYNKYPENDWMPKKMHLIIDAPFWVGDKSNWEKLIQEEGIIEMKDNMIAYELANIRYHNLIGVQKIDFLEKYLCIFLEGEKVLSIAYDNESDYAWILEDDKDLQERVIVGCDGIRIFSRNIPVDAI
ncbi:hypothetical protein C804_02717 [Lachnospiraceae bacterium A4]|jgi:hypothetical protein|nr:hypothetical protein C804_02717 [Lachnospiraceae bacterium A4]